MMRKILILTLISILILTLIFISNSNSKLFVYAADAEGNDINFVEVWQWNGTDYDLKGNVTLSGQSVIVNDNQTVKFIVSIKFNSTLASSQNEAVSFTRVYMNITYDSSFIWQNKELNNTSVSGPSGGFYWIKENGVWNSTGYPAAGVTYECSILYQGYY